MTCSFLLNFFYLPDFPTANGCIAQAIFLAFGDWFVLRISREIHFKLVLRISLEIHFKLTFDF